MEPQHKEYDFAGFQVEQFFVGCLSEMSYLIESNGEAAVIDPMRDTDFYLNAASKRGTKIKQILESHFHADFISGHLDLAKKTGAQIVFGPGGSEASYKIYEAKDEEVLTLGNIKIQVLHTPGHTSESSSYVVTDKNNSIACAFTGDTLFLGDVGRPDLAVTTQLTEKDLAGMMYDSLQNKILKLPDECVIFPGHGIGSACGKNISSGLCDTLHNQKQTNYALQPITKEEFITVLTTNIPKAPGYFPQAAKLNKSGYMLLSDVIEKNSVLLPADKFKQKIDEGILVIDTRSVKDFIQGFIPGSISISLEMNFSPWVGKLINHEVPILLVCDPHREKEAVMRLARIGYENIQGILDGGCAAWVNKGYQTNKGYSIEVSALKNIMEKEQPFILDVRGPGEQKAVGYVEGATNIELGNLEQTLSNNQNALPKDKDIYVHCKTGGRATTALSILKRHGFNQVHNIVGGYDKMVQEGITYKKE